MVFLCGELWRHENERESGTTCPGLLTVETRTLLRVVSRVMSHGHEVKTWPLSLFFLSVGQVKERCVVPAVMIGPHVGHNLQRKKKLMSRHGGAIIIL